MLDCQVALLTTALAAYLRLGEIAQPQGSRNREIAPFQVYTTHDGYLVIAAGNDHLLGLMARRWADPTCSTTPITRPTPYAEPTSINSKSTWSGRCACGEPRNGSTS